MINTVKNCEHDIIGNHKIVGQIYETTDYDVFRFKLENREVHDSLLLRESIERVGILCPVIVNEKMEVIDGQNRVVLATKLKLPIPYIVNQGNGSDEIIEINTTSKNWDLVDFIKLYAIKGISSYEKMLHLIESYNVPVSIMVGLAFNTTDSSRPMKKTRDGQLDFVNYDFLVSFLEFYDELVTDTIIKPSAPLASSLYTLYRLEKFNVDRIFQRSGDIAMRINGMGKQGVITEAILQSYNERLRGERGNAIHYRKDAKGNIQFVNEKIKQDVR